MQLQTKSVNQHWHWKNPNEQQNLSKIRAISYGNPKMDKLKTSGRKNWILANRFAWKITSRMQILQISIQLHLAASAASHNRDGLYSKVLRVIQKSHDGKNWNSVDSTVLGTLKEKDFVLAHLNKIQSKMRLHDDSWKVLFDINLFNQVKRFNR